jgi:hypothetical protein
MKKTGQNHFKKRIHEVHIQLLLKYGMHLEAVRWNEGFRQETDAAFTMFWEREGASIMKTEIIQQDGKGNTISSTPLGELIKGPLDLDPHVLFAYLHSSEAHQVQRKYGLLYPYHYNQTALLCFHPGRIEVMTSLDATEYASEIKDKPVTIFQSPCLKAVRDQELEYLDLKINLSWPKKEIMNIFELLLDKAMYERELAGKKTFTRGMAVDSFPFKAWYMNKKEGKNPWEITQELFPFTKVKSYRDWEENYDPKTRSQLRIVERAIEKAEKLISSVTPVN